ncbi:hypothetical protein QNM99_17900 [Pseudomonas sp. PCH446]
MTVLSRTEYAASKGWSRQYVGKLAKQGRLIFNPDGKVDVEATDQYLEMTGDPARSNAGARIAPAIVTPVQQIEPPHSGHYAIPQVARTTTTLKPGWLSRRQSGRKKIFKRSPAT